jgi:hypothetical protein
MIVLSVAVLLRFWLRAWQITTHGGARKLDSCLWMTNMDMDGYAGTVR